MLKKCKRHGLTDHAPIKGRKNGYRCRKCTVEAVQKRREAVKQMSIDYKGGCCNKCGYSKCNKALEFHRLDPTKKDFSISYNGNTYAWTTVKKELDKCVLLCANCHREKHAGLF